MQVVILHVVATDCAHNWYLHAAQFVQDGLVTKRHGCVKTQFKSAHSQKCTMKAGWESRKAATQQQCLLCAAVNNSTPTSRPLCNGQW